MKRHICNTDHLNLAIVQRFSHPSFTGKETDCETGLSYFGARYYDPTLLTSFLSNDRYADKYPSLSPYHYCAWNPIRLVDPNGDTIRIQNEDGSYRNVELYQIANWGNSKDSREQALYCMYQDSEGTAILEGLSKSTTCYDIQQKSKMKGGIVHDEHIVAWGDPAANYGGSEANIIIEEMYHCAQYEGINGMSWTGDVETGEIPAKEFSARICPDFDRYFKTGAVWVATEMNIMAGGYCNVDSFSSQDKLNFLTKPFQLQTYRSDPTKGSIEYHTQTYWSSPAY